MADQPVLKVETVAEVEPGAPEEIDIDAGVEVGFIVATTCTSLELEEDDELSDDDVMESVGAGEDESAPQ